jgi:hypothetical protein
MKILIRSLGLFIVLLTVLSCGGIGRVPGPFRDFSFRVDSVLLGEYLTLQDVKLRVPARWSAAEPEAMAAIQQAALRDTERFALAPIHVFHDSLGAVLVLSRFRHYTDSLVNFAGFARQYETEFRRSHSNPEAAVEWLTLSEIPAVQFYTSDSLRVQFMFLLSSDPPLNLAVSVPRRSWRDEVRSVESMLGTVRRIH